MYFVLVLALIILNEVTDGSCHQKTNREFSFQLGICEAAVGLEDAGT